MTVTLAVAMGMVMVMLVVRLAQVMRMGVAIAMGVVVGVEVIIMAVNARHALSSSPRRQGSIGGQLFGALRDCGQL